MDPAETDGDVYMDQTHAYALMKRQPTESSDEAIKVEVPVKKKRKPPVKQAVLPTDRKTRGAGAPAGHFEGMFAVLEETE